VEGRAGQSPAAARGSWMLGIKDGIKMYRMDDGFVLFTSPVQGLNQQCPNLAVICHAG
jgi:hypothetical protein